MRNGLTLWCLLLCIIGHAQDMPVSIIQKHLAEMQASALGAAVIRSDSIVLCEVAGVQKRGSTQPVARDAYWHIGSNTKAITAYIAGHMMEEGRLNWQTSFFSLFPEWKDEALPAYHHMTLADLLSHRARIKPFTSGFELLTVPAMVDSQQSQREQFARFVLKQEPVPPSEKPYTYSNAGYTLAAMMLEEASGKSWEELVQQYMVDDLGLRVQYGWPNKIDSTQPWGHMAGLAGKPRPTPPDDAYVLEPYLAPAGNISMPLRDYARFVQFHLQAEKGQPSHLKQSTYDSLHQARPEYSFGFASQGDSVFFHDGSAGTFYMHFVMLPKKDIALVLVANSADKKTLEAIFALRQELFEYYIKKKD